MSKLLINEHPLQVLPSLAKAIGLNEAIALQQLHYWLEKSQHVHGGRRWVYNSATEWQKQFIFWSESTIRRTFTNLRERGLALTANYNKLAMDKTLWYSIDYEELAKLETPFDEIVKPFDGIVTPSSQSDEMEVVKLDIALPETTTETTTERDDDDGKSEKLATLGEVHTLWQQNMPGTLTAILVDDINDLVDTYGAQEVKDAITQAIRNNGRTIRYVQKVLQNRATGQDKRPAKDKPKTRQVVTIFNQYTGAKEEVTL